MFLSELYLGWPLAAWPAKGALGWPLAAWPAKGALRDKSWKETIFKINVQQFNDIYVMCICAISTMYIVYRLN